MTSRVVLGATDALLFVGSQIGKISQVVPVVGVAAVALGTPALMFMGVRSLTSRIVTQLNYSEDAAKSAGIAVGVFAGTATFCVVWSALLFTSVLEELNRNY
jgi:hypothetical protein